MAHESSFCCPRCEWRFTLKHNLLRHLRSPNVCVAKSLEHDRSPQELLAELCRTVNKAESGHCCDECGGKFTTAKSLKRHMVQQHPTPPRCTDCNSDDVKVLAERVRQLTEEVHKLRDRPTVVVNNNKDCTFQNINAFGNENTEYLRSMPSYKSFMKNCILEKF